MKFLLLGSSIVSKWPSPRGISTTNRGISGLLARELPEYLMHILAYRGSPDKVLIYCGGNDVRIGTDPTEVADPIARFVDAIIEKWPNASIILLAVLLSPSVRAWPTHLRAARGINRRLQQYASARPAVEMAVFSSSNYAKDGTHLTSAGYRELNAHLFPV